MIHLPVLGISQVTLVDQSEHFVFKPLLYELLNGTARPDEVAPHYGQLLAPYATRFVQVRCLGSACCGCRAVGAVGTADLCHTP